MGRRVRVAPGELSRAMKEGREARKDGRPRKSPYEDIPALAAFHLPWLDGWDSMNTMLETKKATP